MFNLSDRLKSFRYAFSGLRVLLKSQHNAWIHLTAAAGIIALGFILQISRPDWCRLTIAIVMVLAAEAFNTALEFLADALHPEQHPLIGKAKDAAAGAVLLTAIGAAVIGLLTLGPYFAAAFK